MKYGKDILSHVNNIEYEAQELLKCLNKQIDEDGKTFVNVDPCEIRFNCFGCIGSACTQIDIYCQGIRANVGTAEEQDDKIKLKENVDDQTT